MGDNGRNDKGQFGPGNSFAKLGRNELKQELINAIKAEENIGKKTFWKRIAERCFVNDKVLIAVLDRIGLPPEQKIQVQGEIAETKVLVLRQARSREEEDFITKNLDRWRDETKFDFEDSTIKLQDEKKEPTEEEAEAIKLAQEKEDEKGFAIDKLKM